MKSFSRSGELVREAVRLAAEHYNPDAAAEIVAFIEELYMGIVSGERQLVMRRLLQLYSIALVYLGRHEPRELIALTEDLLRLAETANESPDQEWYARARILAKRLEDYASKALGG